MASDNEASCVCDPNFAVICSFLEKFAKSCGITHPNFLELQEMLENSQEVPQPLVDLHVKLLRKARKSVSGEKWERALIKFCHSYSNQDGWEVERFGYKKARLAVKLRILKMLLELQFDLNTKFKTEVNRLSAEELRSQPLGRDKLGQTYWCQLDEDCNLRVYREDLDDETWEIVAKDRDGMVQLISQLSSNDPFRNGPDAVLNEDSNSLEIDKPIIDTGQVVESPANEKELEEIEDGVEKIGGEQEKKTQSDLKSNFKNGDNKAPVKELVKESQDMAKPIAVNAKVTANNTNEVEDKAKGDIKQSEEKRAQDCLLVKEKTETNSSEVSVKKDSSKSETNKEKDVLGNEKGTIKHSVDHNEKDPKPVKDTSKPSTESKESSALQSTSTFISKKGENSAISKKIDTSSKREGDLSSDPKKSEELVLLAEKNKTPEKTSTDIKPGSDVSVKKPCISVRPLEQLVSKDRLINPLQLQPKIILQKQNFSRGIISNLKEQMNQEMVRKNLETHDFKQKKIKNEDFSKGIINELTSKNLKIQNIEDTLGLRLERDEWNDGGFDLSPPVIGNKLTGNGSRGLDLSGKKIAGIPFAQGISIAETIHKTQENICDLSIRRPADSYSLIKDTQRHSMNMIENTFYKGNSGLATDLTLRKYSSHIDFPQTMKEDKRIDNTSNFEIKASPNTLPEKLKSLECVGIRNLQNKDLTVSATRRDVNDAEISQAKKPRFENFPKTAGNSTVVGEAIEEPLMLIRGEGFGKDCNMGNPVLITDEGSGVEVSEAIEEPILFVWGEGLGRDCDTGNTSRDADSDETNKNAKSSNTQLDEVKNVSMNKNTSDNQDVGLDKEIDVEENASGGHKSSDISSSKEPTNPWIDKKSDKSETSSFMLSKEFSKDFPPKKSSSSESSNDKLTGEDSSTHYESSNIKSEKDTIESTKQELGNSNSLKISDVNKSDTQLELSFQDKGMKESINTKLKKFHSSEIPQNSSNQSHCFPISTAVSAPSIQPLSSSEIVSLSPGAPTVNPGIDLTQTPGERLRGTKMNLPSKEIEKDRLMNKGESFQHAEAYKTIHSSESKPETTSASSISKQLSSQISSHHRSENDDILDMSVKKDNLTHGELKIFSESAQTVSSSSASLSLENKSVVSIVRSHHLNIDLDKTKSEISQPNEAPLPVTKRFLYQTCGSTKGTENISLKIPEPDRGDARGKFSPTKTPPKLWSIETICAPDQKIRESKEVPVSECGSSNPTFYPKPDLHVPISPNKPKWTLGVQVIEKSSGDNTSLHKKPSRWDVGKPLEETKSEDTQDIKESKTLAKDNISKVPIVDSFSSAKSLSVDSEEQFGKKVEIVSSSNMGKTCPVASDNRSLLNERLHGTTKESFSHSDRMSSSNSNINSSVLNMPLDVRLHETPRKQETKEGTEDMPHNLSKSSLPETQNVKLSGESFQKPDKDISLLMDKSACKLPVEDKEKDGSSFKFGSAGIDKHSSLFSHQNYFEKEKIPTTRFIPGPHRFEFTDKKSDVADKPIVPNSSKFDVNDKVKNPEDKKDSSESSVKKDGDKIVTKSDTTCEKNIGKVVDFLTQKNAGRSLGISADKSVIKSLDDKTSVKGMASATERGGRKSTDSSGSERSIDKVIGLLTEKSARMAESKNAEKLLDSNKQQLKEKIVDKTVVKTSEKSDKVVSGINICSKVGNSDGKTLSDKPIQNIFTMLEKKSTEENKNNSPIVSYLTSTTTEKSEIKVPTVNACTGKEEKLKNKNEENLIVSTVAVTTKCKSSSGEIRSSESKSDISSFKATDEQLKAHDFLEAERVKTPRTAEENSCKNLEKQIEKFDAVSSTSKPVSPTSSSKEDKSSEDITKFDFKDIKNESLGKMNEKNHDEKSKVISKQGIEPDISKQEIKSLNPNECVDDKPMDVVRTNLKESSRIDETKLSDTSEKITADYDESRKMSSDRSSVRKEIIDEKKTEKPSETLSGTIETKLAHTFESIIKHKPDNITGKSEISVISHEKNENSSFKNRKISSNIESSENMSSEPKGSSDSVFENPEGTNIKIEKSVKTDVELEKISQSEIENLKKMTEGIPEAKPEKHDEISGKLSEKSVSPADKLSEHSANVTGNRTCTEILHVTKEDITKEITKFSSEPCIISSSKGEGNEKKFVTSTEKEMNKEKEGISQEKPIEKVTKEEVEKNIVTSTEKRVNKEEKDRISRDKPNEGVTGDKIEKKILTSEEKDISKIDKKVNKEEKEVNKKEKEVSKEEKDAVNKDRPIERITGEETEKLIVTSEEKEVNKDEKGGVSQDKRMERPILGNVKSDPKGPFCAKPLSVQGKNIPGNMSVKVSQPGIMGSGKGRRKSVENITMGIMMSKLAGKSGLESQSKFPIPLLPDNKIMDKVTNASSENQPKDKQMNELARPSEKASAVDPPASPVTEKSEPAPKRTGFITLKPIETLLEKPRINFQDVKDMKQDFSFIKKPLENMPLPDKPYLYPVTDPATERIVDKVKTVPGRGVTPIIKPSLDQQKMEINSENVQPLRRSGILSSEKMDTTKEMRSSATKPDIKQPSIQKCSVSLENLSKNSSPSGQDDKPGLLPTVQSSEKLLQTLNTSVSIVEKPIPAKEAECEKVQHKVDVKEKHQNLTVTPKDVSISSPKARGQSSPSKIQASSPPKLTNKSADPGSKLVQSKDTLKSLGNKDSQKCITGDIDLDNKLLKSGTVSVNIVSNADKKKNNNSEAKETTLSKSKNSTKSEETPQKGKVGNSKTALAPKEKVSDPKPLQTVAKSSTPKDPSDVKESDSSKKDKKDETCKSSENKDSLTKLEEKDTKDEKTEVAHKEADDKVDKVMKDSQFSTGVSIQSLTFDYMPDSKTEEIASIRTRLTRSHGKPTPKFPEKQKKGKSAKPKPVEKKEKEEEREEPPVTRSRRTRSSGPLPPVEVKKPIVNKSNKAGASNEKNETKAKPVAQKRKNNRKLDSQSEDEGVAAEGRRKRSLAESETMEDAGGKRRKLRSKRTPDLQLRRSVEEQKLREGGDSSSDEDKCNNIPLRLEDTTDESQQAAAEDSSMKGRGKSAGRQHKAKARGKGKVPRAATESPVISSDALSDTSRTELSATSKPSPKKTRRILGLDVGVDIMLEESGKESGAGPSSGPPVRQSRRIAQIKIKEEAERRKLEEMTLMELKEQQRRRKRDEKNDSKDSKSDKRKRKKKAAESDEDFTVEEEPEEPATSKKKKKKKKKRKKKYGKGFNDNPWQSTSGSSSSSSLEEEEEQEQTEEEEEESNLVFKSDHEFSPESDLENEAGEIQPTRRARTAQKESDGEEVADDHACQKCGKSDHPEWILLCDKCDSGWHGSCLRPALLVIPEGDWFCPPCEHTFLLTNLQDNLREYDKSFKRRENEELRRKRLAYVGISLDNVLPNKDKDIEDNAIVESEKEKSSSSSESGSSSGEESEPLYHLRERRQTLFSYRFNEYDDLINSAIQDEMEAVKGAGNQGRGKDIATIVNAEKEEMAAAGMNGLGKEEKPKRIDKDDGDDYQEEEEDDDEEEEVEGYIPPVRKYIGRKKHRRLNSLDISSEDDADSDEDFKGSSSEDEEEEEDDLEVDDSDDSEVIGRRGKGGRRSKRMEPVRRSTRARITRFDKEFINDDSDDSIEPRRKKTRRLWQESDSSESDSTWGRKKKRKYHAEPLRFKSKKKKKKKHSKSADGENSNRPKNPRIKYGGLDDDDDEDDDTSPMPRTRGRKINYQEIPGSESEEELMKAVTKGLESEDEYVASEEEEEKMMEDDEEVEPEDEEDEEAEEDESEIKVKAKAETELKLKIKSKPQPKQDADEVIKNKEEEEEEDDEEAEIEEEEEDEEEEELVARVVKAVDEVKCKTLPEPELPSKVDIENNDGKVEAEEDNLLSPKAGRKKREKTEKKPRAPRKPREKKPKEERKPKAERRPKKPRVTRPKKLVICDDSDDEFENFEDFDDLEEGEIRLGAMLDEREELMDDELLDEELMDEDKEMEDMLEEELLDEELDEEDEEDELLALKEAELALQQAELEKAKEKKRQKREAKKLEKKEQKKRGRKPKRLIDMSSLPTSGNTGLEVGQVTGSLQNIMKEVEIPAQTIEPVLPVLSNIPDTVAPKRKGRGRAKASLASVTDTLSAVGGLRGKLSEPQLGSSMLGGVGPPRYPGPNPQQSQPMAFPSQPPNSNSSVISRMLQSQPVSAAPQSFTAAAAAMGHKYFGGPGSDQPPLVGPCSVPPGNQNVTPSSRPSGPVGQSFSMPTRGRIPSPYRQPPPLTSSPSGSPGLNMPHYVGMRGSPVRPPPGSLQQTSLSPLRMRTPGPGAQMYHTSHHPLDPSPSGGGPIAIAPNNGVRPGGEGSPLHQAPTQIPPAAGSPLANKSGPPSHSTPPPPPYTRPAMHQQGPPVPPPLIRFPLQSTDVASNGRHPQSSFPPSTTTGSHLQAQPSPPPHQGRSPAPGNFSPYHPPPPPNYHYGAYPPPPPLTAADDALPPSAYQGSPYPDHYASPDAPHSLQASDGSNSKSYDEEGGGEFGGLVSYFSSQREDDLDT